jgi:arabinogalactan oligomer/maltooligosaccharide transport system permease protein
VLSIRDGLQGGVWREAWAGLSGQTAPVPVTAFYGAPLGVTREVRDRGEVAFVPLFPAGLSYDDQVHYAGPALLWRIAAGAGADTMVFEVLWTALSVGLQGALGLAVALALHRRGLRFKGVWRAIFILPWAIPEFVGALIWAHVFEPTNGWLSLALHTPLNWQDDPLAALGVLLVAAVWLGWPLMMLAATAGLSMIPREVYDAAAIDGADGWQVFRLITWPLLLPLLLPALVIRAIFAFNQFYLFYVMRAHWPLVTFATISFYLFDTNRRTGGQFAVSAALNLFIVLVLALFVWGFSRWSKAAEEAGYA